MSSLNFLCVNTYLGHRISISADAIQQHLRQQPIDTIFRVMRFQIKKETLSKFQTTYWSLRFSFIFCMGPTAFSENGAKKNWRYENPKYWYQYWCRLPQIFINQSLSCSVTHAAIGPNLNKVASLTHCGLLTPYKDINLGQHGLR